MGRFSRRFKRNPATGFVGKKFQEKQMRKMFFEAQQEYWRQLNAGLITEDGEPIGVRVLREHGEPINSEDIEVDLSDPLDSATIQP